MRRSELALSRGGCAVGEQRGEKEMVGHLLRTGAGLVMHLNRLVNAASSLVRMARISVAMDGVHSLASMPVRIADITSFAKR